MNEPRQKIMETIGKWGCYFLSIVHLAEELLSHRIDAVEKYLEITTTKSKLPELDGAYIMSENCYISSPLEVLKTLVGGEWISRVESKTYKIQPGDYVIAKYERHTPNGPYSHFVVLDEYGSVKYDPYGGSATVRDGQIVTMRVFRRGK